MKKLLIGLLTCLIFTNICFAKTMSNKKKKEVILEVLNFAHKTKQLDLDVDSLTLDFNQAQLDPLAVIFTYLRFGDQDRDGMTVLINNGQGVEQELSCLVDTNKVATSNNPEVMEYKLFLHYCTIENLRTGETKQLKRVGMRTWDENMLGSEKNVNFGDYAPTGTSEQFESNIFSDNRELGKNLQHASEVEHSNGSPSTVLSI